MLSQFWSEQSSMSWDDDLRPMINDMTCWWMEMVAVSSV